MGIKLDVLGYRYPDDEPAFTVVESGQFYYHLLTRRLFDKAKFDAYLLRVQKEFPPGEVGFPPGELGLPTEDEVDISEDQLENLYLFSHTQLRDVLPDDHHDKLHELVDLEHHKFPDSPSGKFLKDNGTWGDTTPSGSIETSFVFSTATGGSPASGIVAVNNADQALADEVHISTYSSGGNDVSPMVGGLGIGDIVGISEDLGSGTVWYELTAPPVNNTTWFSLAVALYSGTGGVPDAADVAFGIVPDPDNKLPAGGVPPNVLKKFSSDNYDGVWENVDHSELEGVNPDNHHPQSHAHDGADDSGTVAHSDLTGRTANDHHAEVHDHSDGSPAGTISHRDIKNRSEDFCHPTAAITGLDNAQAAQDTAIQGNADNLTAHEQNVTNPHEVQHEQVGGITADDHHDQVHALLSSDHADVETGTALEVGSAFVWNGNKFEPLNLFTFAAYGGIWLDTSTPLADLGAGYTPLAADTDLITSPRLVIQNAAANTFGFGGAGVFSVNVNFTMSHDESNSGREFMVRFHNVTAGVSTRGTLIGIGRNQSVSNFSATVLLEISSDVVGDQFRVEVGGGDDVSTIVLDAFEVNVTGTGEYRG